MSIRSNSKNDLPCSCRTVSRCSQQETSQRGTAADSMAAHHEDLGLGTAHRQSVETQSMAIEPFRTRLLVVPKPKPQALELSKLLAVLVPPKINDVGDAECFQPLDVLPGSNGTAEP